MDMNFFCEGRDAAGGLGRFPMGGKGESPGGLKS